MRRGWLGMMAIVAAVAGGTTACTVTVPGSGVAAPSVPAAPDPSVPAVPSAPAGPRSGLDADVISDECLLNASEFGALVGEPVRPPEQSTVARGDGSTGASCVATAGEEPVAMVNVYTVRSGTPADYVLAAPVGGRRELAGVGEAATVIDTQAGPTLQLAGPAHLVTILVAGRTPSDEAWRAAATAALSRLPR